MREKVERFERGGENTNQLVGKGRQNQAEGEGRVAIASAKRRQSQGKSRMDREARRSDP